MAYVLKTTDVTDSGLVPYQDLIDESMELSLIFQDRNILATDGIVAADFDARLIAVSIELGNRDALVPETPV